MLKDAGLSDFETIYGEYVNEYPVAVPDKSSVNLAIKTREFYANSDLHQVHLAATDRAVNGVDFYNHLLASGTFAYDGISSATTGDETILTTKAGEFMTWVQSLYLQPADGQQNPAWHKSHMEYQFAGTIADKGTAGATPTVLVAKEYYQGTLDWYSFDIASQWSDVDGVLTNGVSGTEVSSITEEKTTMIPGGVQFDGAPNERWWEFEDARIDLGDLTPSETDVAKIMFSEYSLVYANEWSLIPYEIPVGSLNEMVSIVVTDVFGQKIVIEAAGRGDDNDWQRWNMYNMNYADVPEGSTISVGGKNFSANLADNRLFIPPTLHRVQESDPIEKVHFIRDEMANMVWGVEKIIPDELGGGTDGREAAYAVHSLLTDLADFDTNAIPLAPLDDVLLKYQLLTEVPENWIPFVAVHVGTNDRAIQLQRAAMPRFIPGLDLTDITLDAELVRPRTPLLKDPASPYYVYEEEVPRSGTSVSSTFQRARWYNGSTHLWLGRRKRNGRGEGSSGLVYDQVIHESDGQPES